MDAHNKGRAGGFSKNEQFMFLTLHNMLQELGRVADHLGLPDVARGCEDLLDELETKLTAAGMLPESSEGKDSK